MKKGGKLEGWKVEKLGDVIQKTETINPLQTPNKEFIYIDVSSVNNKTLSVEETSLIKGKDAPSRARKLIKAGDVIFATVRPTLKRIAVIPEEYDHQVCSTGYFVLRGKEFINNKYLFYYLQTDSFNERMEKLQKGASYPAVTDTEVKEQIISYPPLPEQQRIVSVLDEAFASIAGAKSNAERNLVNARELFETISHDIFSSPHKDWQEQKLGDLCEKITKGSSPKWQGIRYVNEPGVLFVTSENVGMNEIILDKRKYVEEKFNISDKKSILQKGDVLTNIVGASIGRTAIFNLDDLANINQAVCILRCKEELLHNLYLSHLLNSPFFRDILHDNEVDNARANLSLGFFSNLTIPVPPLAEQRAIVGRLEALSAETGRLEEIYQSKVEALEELKRSVLAKAFDGEL